MEQPTPSVEEILLILPECFVDNGPSSPFRFLHKFLYGSHGVKVLGIAARSHDAGYSILRLPGSGYEFVTRHQWDVMYRNYIWANQHEFAAIIEYRGLRLGGGVAWNKLWDLMHAKYLTFNDYLVYKSCELSLRDVSFVVSPFTGLKRKLKKKG